MSTPPHASPTHTLLTTVNLATIPPPEESDSQPLQKRQRTETTHLSTWQSQTHPSSTLPQSESLNHASPTNEQTPPQQPNPHSLSQTTPAITSAPTPHKEGRRTWNRRYLEQNGADDTLLNALDTFVTTAPIIPTLKDSSRKIYVRNMRGWILHLELPVYTHLWQALIDVIQADNSFTATCPHWDHDLCRYILGKIVQDNQNKQNHNHPKQSRQAVNNAIKRELTCPLEAGNSSRGKTFRDLFRLKCRKGNVSLPQIEQPQRQKRSSDHPETASPSTHPPSHTLPPVPAPVAQSAKAIAPAAGEESFVTYLAIPSVPPPPSLLDDSELAKLRVQCVETDEWNRTAWWKLLADEDVKKLPLLLVHSHLYELHSLLIDFRWISRTFHCVDFKKGMRQVPTDGYDVMLKHVQKPGTEHTSLDMEGFRLIRNALMIILPILSQENRHDPTEPTFIAHLATQLVGRLLDLKRRFPNIACLIQSIEEHAPRPWLRPLTRCFHQPRTDIKLAVPSNGIFTPHLIALSEDGTLLATSATSFVSFKKETSRMGTNSSQRSSIATESLDSPHMATRKVFSVVIWDVQSGKCVCKGPEIPNILRHLTLSRDNNCIIGETVDGLFFWHMDKSQETWTISQQVEATPRIKSISSITAAVGSSRVLTTHRLEQEPIVLWDTKTGQKLECFDQVTSPANCLDVSGGGDFFASGHDNGFIHLWTMKDKEPLLSFKNEGADRGPQQVVALSEVNGTRVTQYPPRTISISFYEKGEERWLTAVSANHVIRVWLLPPRHISHDQWKSFVSSRRTAVVKCPLIREVKWSQNGNFFSGGEDGVARMWRMENGNWEWYAIEKENGERSQDLSNVEVSCGKRSEVVATHVAKSAYVTVWDMSSMERAMKSGKRRRLYRWFSPMVANSVDSRDICRLGAGDMGVIGGMQESEMAKGSKWMRTYGDNIGMIRTELGQYFGNLDPKSSTTADGKMQPWLRVQAGGGGGSGLEEDESKALRVCFEQPVKTGQSGVFKWVGGKKDRNIGDMYGMGVDVDVDRWGKKREVERRGMAAALQDGTVGMFEVEGVKGKEEGEIAREVVDVEMVENVKSTKEVVTNVGGGEEESVGKEKNGMETYSLPASMYVEDEEKRKGGAGGNNNNNDEAHNEPSSIAPYPNGHASQLLVSKPSRKENASLSPPPPAITLNAPPRKKASHTTFTPTKTPSQRLPSHASPRSFSSMPADTPQPSAHTVTAIFQRAERVFERRVDQLLQAKRHKALEAGTPFNARKAKRDARTVAGREKLDALVRRLADLAVVQEAVLGEQGTHHVARLLDGAAAVVFGVAALTVRDKCCLDTSSCSDEEKKDDERTLFAATESVVNFVLDDDFEPLSV